MHVHGRKEETMKPQWKAITMGLAVLCLSAPAMAQTEPSAPQGDADTSAAQSRKSDGAKVGWQPKFSGFTFKVGAQMDVAPGKANGDGGVKIHACRNAYAVNQRAGRCEWIESKTAHGIADGK